MMRMTFKIKGKFGDKRVIKLHSSLKISKRAQLTNHGTSFKRNKKNCSFTLLSYILSTGKFLELLRCVSSYFSYAVKNYHLLITKLNLACQVRIQTDFNRFVENSQIFCDK